MKKDSIRNVSIILVAYILLVGVTNSASSILVEFMPTVLLFGTLITSVITGYLMRPQGRRGFELVAIIIPYLLGVGVYGIARILKSAEWIALYRKMMPHCYAQVSLLNKITFERLPKDMQVILAVALIAMLSYVCMRLGMKLQRSQKTVCKLIYNNILLWGIHFYMFAILGGLVTLMPRMLTDDGVRITSGAVVTVVIFVVYFVIGKYSKTFENIGMQMLSCCSVTLTATVMYVASLLLVYPSGRYEIFIIPVAQSFFGVMGKELAMVLGQSADYISQYGYVVSVLLLLVPMVLVCIGNVTSRPTLVLQDENEEVSNGEEVLSN
ncbi:MAG: hypothetical protein ACRCTE_08450 [Cellulosilyticaceae bacterium]